MKIFFPIGAFYPSQIGGPCNTLYWHVCALSKEGIDVNIVTTTLGIRKGNVKENQIINNECGTVFYGKGNFNSPKIAIKSLVEIKNAQIIHLNSLFDLLSISSFFYSKFFFPEKKIVLSVRGQLNPIALKFSGWKKRPLIYLYQRFSNGILFHATSDQEVLDIKKVFKNGETVLIPNFIKPYIRLKVEKKKQILFMGRIHPIKALHKLIEGLALSKRFIGSDFKMILIGNYDGRQYGYFMKLMKLVKKYFLEGKVEFKGHIHGKEKEKLYAESYVLVLPSETENFGNVVPEALNQGTPVIASKGTPWSILEEYNCGYHIDNSPKKIAEALDRMVDLEPDEYDKLCRNTQKLVDKEFDVSLKIKQWIMVYKNLFT